MTTDEALACGTQDVHRLRLGQPKLAIPGRQGRGRSGVHVAEAHGTCNSFPGMRWPASWPGGSTSLSTADSLFWPRMPDPQEARFYYYCCSQHLLPALISIYCCTATTLIPTSNTSTACCKREPSGDRGSTCNLANLDRLHHFEGEGTGNLGNLGDQDYRPHPPTPSGATGQDYKIGKIDVEKRL